MHSFPRLFLLLPLALALLGGTPAFAAIEVSRGDGPATTLRDVYQRDGVAYVAIEDVLAILGMSGQWDNVAHVYRITVPQGVAVISPGSSYLRLEGGRSIAVAQRPTFIDGRLRVSETFLADQFAPFLDLPLRLKNLDPAATPPPETPLDQLFSMLLLQRPKAATDSQWVVAIDPGHGGQDAGSIGGDGTTEQSVNLGVALQLQKLLKMRRGAPVVMTRDADYAVASPQRLEAVARGRADVLLSLHAQAHFSPEARGIMLFVAPESAVTPLATPDGANPVPPPVPPAVNASLHLAEALRSQLVGAGYRVDAVQQRALQPLGQGNLPRVLVEMGYLSNPDDLARLRDAGQQLMLAQALFNGLDAFQKNYQDLQEPAHESQPPAAQQ